MFVGRRIVLVEKWVLGGFCDGFELIVVVGGIYDVFCLKLYRKYCARAVIIVLRWIFVLNYGVYGDCCVVFVFYGVTSGFLRSPEAEFGYQ